MNLIRTLNVAVLVFLVAISVPSTLSAQNLGQDQKGKVEGSLEDRLGQRIQEATIEFEAKVGGKKPKRKTKSNRDGVFEIALPAGKYQVTIKYSGFRDFRRKELRVESAKTLTLNVVLEIDPKKTLQVNE